MSYRRSDFLDRADHFVSRNARIGQTWKPAFFRERIAVTDSARFNLDQDLVFPGFGNLELDNFKVTLGTEDHHCFHCRHEEVSNTGFESRMIITEEGNYASPARAFSLPFKLNFLQIFNSRP